MHHFSLNSTRFSLHQMLLKKVQNDLASFQNFFLHLVRIQFFYQDLKHPPKFLTKNFFTYSSVKIFK